MGRSIAGAAVWITAVAAAAIGILWWMAFPSNPDAFYEPPREAAATPGALLRSEAFTRGVPAGARGWRILYATTRGDGRAATASAIVVVAGDLPGPRAIVAWAHGTTGIAPGCAPSMMGKPFANVPALESALREGWAYVATDYAGLGSAGPHAYLVGEEAARGILDSVRAARRIDGLDLDSRVVVWGHSQGGHSALWTGMRAAALAPDITLLGVGAFAPASELPGLFAAAQGTMFGKIVSAYLVHAFGATYPDVDAAGLVRPGYAWLARDIASRCVGEWQTLFSVAQTVLLPNEGFLDARAAAGPLAARLHANTPRGPFPTPVFVAQGDRDDLVLPDLQKRYVERLCRDGQPIAFRTYPGRDHISLVAPNSPLEADIMAWTRDRFARKAQAHGCGTP